jgi:outer membrane lipoprotein-sorting protein
MRTLKSIILPFVAIILLVTSSCNKYEEGPFFSFRSAKHRLVRDWRMTEKTEDGTSTKNHSQKTDLFFGKKGGFKRDENYPSNGVTINDNEVGTWGFNKKKTEIIITPQDNSEMIIWTILELRDDKLIIKRILNKKELVEFYVAS